ncbi:MAG: hypothetical protein GXY61_03195 [Lentisphaerae bacterium]|jgi:hypothetical protein|nr:hypothetical protein [Lentisphaerota bacterium]
MTTLTLNIKDDSKVQDVLRFLGDIDFLEVLQPVQENQIEKSFSSVQLKTEGYRFDRDSANER